LKPAAGIRRSRQRGVAAVEFALILPFITVLILAMCDYGYYFYIGINATEAARATAAQASSTAAAMYAGTGVPTCGDALISNVTGSGAGAPSLTAAAYMTTNVSAAIGLETTATVNCTMVPAIGGKPLWGVVVTVDFPPASGKLHFGLPPSSTAGNVRYRTPTLYRR
jgi:Flp pilus assembly protein TadG